MITMYLSIFFLKTHTSLFGLICLINDIRDLLKQPEQNIIRKI